ncbi:MAG: hypothetical protein LH610_00015 [Sphingomonas bacterium]|nr:hypothetical protein [Sphingomonas bacterium]
MTLTDIKTRTGRNRWTIAFILILLGGFMVGGYMVGKDMALRDNARDAAPSGLSAKG